MRFREAWPDECRGSLAGESDTMLIVRRRVGERIVVGDGIEIVVTGVTARTVSIGIQAPRGVLVLRGEVHDTIVSANASALASALGALSSEGAERPETVVVQEEER
jgi:carbon storage regulator